MDSLTVETRAFAMVDFPVPLGTNLTLSLPGSIEIEALSMLQQFSMTTFILIFPPLGIY